MANLLVGLKMAKFPLGLILWRRSQQSFMQSIAGHTRITPRDPKDPKRYVSQFQGNQIKNPLKRAKADSYGPKSGQNAGRLEEALRTRTGGGNGKLGDNFKSPLTSNRHLPRDRFRKIRNHFCAFEN